MSYDLLYNICFETKLKGIFLSFLLFYAAATVQIFGIIYHCIVDCDVQGNFQLHVETVNQSLLKGYR